MGFFNKFSENIVARQDDMKGFAILSYKFLKTDGLNDYFLSIKNRMCKWIKL